MIGTFSVPIGQLMMDLIKERTMESLAITMLNKKLKEIIDDSGMNPVSYGKSNQNNL